MASISFLALCAAWPIIGLGVVRLAVRYGRLDFSDTPDFVVKWLLWPLVLIVWALLSLENWARR